PLTIRDEQGGKLLWIKPSGERTGTNEIAKYDSHEAAIGAKTCSDLSGTDGCHAGKRYATRGTEAWSRRSRHSTCWTRWCNGRAAVAAKERASPDSSRTTVLTRA